MRIPRSQHSLSGLIRSFLSWLFSPLPAQLRRRFLPQLEGLEERCVPAGGTWTPEGPAPEYYTSQAAKISPDLAVTGRVTALAIGQSQGQPALFEGTAGGGVWVSPTLPTPFRPR
jgi:hypothetical protein